MKSIKNREDTSENSEFFFGKFEEIQKKNGFFRNTIFFRKNIRKCFSFFEENHYIFLVKILGICFFFEVEKTDFFEENNNFFRKNIRKCFSFFEENYYIFFSKNLRKFFLF